MDSRDDERLVDLLTRAGQGDAVAASALIPQVYDALRILARRQMAREPAGHTLQPTALVNEAFLRLVGDQDPGWNGRKHFFGAAAQAMRRILIERARRYKRLKHGEGRERVAFEEGELGASHDYEELLDLDTALSELAGEDPRAASIVELRFFAGLGHDEVAEILEVSERTVRREWKVARLWLQDRLKHRDDDGG